MKLTFKQRIIALFTGKIDNLADKTDIADIVNTAVDIADKKPTPSTPSTAVEIPTRKQISIAAAQRAAQPHKKRKLAYEPHAKQCRQKPQQWQQVALTPVRSTACALASKIRHGSNLAFKKPRGGHYEARTAPYMDGYIVEARYMPNKKENKK